MGSRSWAGKENLTEAISDTPMNFRSMLRRILNFELSSDFSEIYASGLEVVVVSAVDAMEVAGDGAGAGDALALFEGDSPEEGEVMLTGLVLGGGWSPSVGRVEGRVAVQYCGVEGLGSCRRRSSPIS